MHRNEKHNFPRPWCRKQIVRAVLAHGTCQNRRTVLPLRMPLNCTDASSNHRTAELNVLDTLALHVFPPAYSSLRQHRDAPHTVDVSSVWLTNSRYGGRQVYLKQLRDSYLLWDTAAQIRASPLRWDSQGTFLFKKGQWSRASSLCLPCLPATVDRAEVRVLFTSWKSV